MAETLKALLKLEKNKELKSKKIRKYRTRKSQSNSRYISSINKTMAIAKTNGKCAVTACNKVYEELHHPQRFAINKSHEKLIPVCRTHHQLAHAGLIKNEEKNSEAWELAFDKLSENIKDKVDRKVRSYWQLE